MSLRRKRKQRHARRATRSAHAGPVGPVAEPGQGATGDAADEVLRALWHAEGQPPYAGYMRAVTPSSPLTELLCARGHAEAAPGHSSGVMLSRTGQRRGQALALEDAP